MGFLFIFPLLIVILALLASCIRIVPQAQALVVERLGAYGIIFSRSFVRFA